MNIAYSITDLIGHTPLLRLMNYEVVHDLPVTLLAKLERANPAGSAKDRVAAYMIAAAEAEGRPRRGGGQLPQQRDNCRSNGTTAAVPDTSAG